MSSAQGRRHRRRLVRRSATATACGMAAYVLLDALAEPDATHRAAALAWSALAAGLLVAACTALASVFWRRAAEPQELPRPRTITVRLQQMRGPAGTRPAPPPGQRPQRP